MVGNCLLVKAQKNIYFHFTVTSLLLTFSNGSTTATLFKFKLNIKINEECVYRHKLVLKIASDSKSLKNGKQSTSTSRGGSEVAVC